MSDYRFVLIHLPDQQKPFDVKGTKSLDARSDKAKM